MKTKIRAALLSKPRRRKTSHIRKKRRNRSSLSYLAARRNRKEIFFLCDACKILGYCKVLNRKYISPEEEAFQQEILSSRVISYDLKKISDLIERDTFSKRTGIFSSIQIRLANEAFHAQEYALAHTHFSILAEESSQDDEAFLGIAICLVYMEKYTESIAALKKCNESFLPDGMPEAFVAAAELRQKLVEIGAVVNDSMHIRPAVLECVS